MTMGVVWLWGAYEVAAYLRGAPRPEYALGPPSDWMWLWTVDAVRWAVVMALTVGTVFTLAGRSSAGWFRHKRQARVPSAASSESSSRKPIAAVLASVLFGLTGFVWLLLDGYFFVREYLFFTSEQPNYGFGDFIRSFDIHLAKTVLGGVGLLIAAGFMLLGRGGGRLLGLVLAGTVCLEGKRTLLHYTLRWERYSASASWYWLLDMAQWVVMIALVLVAVVLSVRRTSLDWFDQRRLAGGAETASPRAQKS